MLNGAKADSLLTFIFIAGQISLIYCDHIEFAPNFIDNGNDNNGGQHSTGIDKSGSDNFLKFLDNLFSFGLHNSSAAPTNDGDSSAPIPSPAERNRQVPLTNDWPDLGNSQEGSIAVDKSGQHYNETEWNNWLVNVLDALDSVTNLSRSLANQRAPLGPPTLKDMADDTGHGAMDSDDETHKDINSTPTLKTDIDSWGNMFKTISADRIPISGTAAQNRNIQDNTRNNTDWNAWLAKVVDALDSITNASKISTAGPALLGSPSEEPISMIDTDKSELNSQPDSSLIATNEETTQNTGIDVPLAVTNTDSFDVTVGEKRLLGSNQADENQNDANGKADELAEAVTAKDNTPEPIEVIVLKNNDKEAEGDIDAPVLDPVIEKAEGVILDFAPPASTPADVEVPDLSAVAEKSFENRGESVSSNQQPVENRKLDVQLVDSIFCRAKCVEQCLTINGDGFFECRAVCKTSRLENLCARDDMPCLTACSINAINHDLIPPNITSIKYYSKETMIDPETSEITWAPVSGAVLYLISLVADTASIRAGANYLIQDITNVPWYSFKKPDLCFQYYVSVAAILHDGITPFSQPVFQQSAVRSIGDLKVEQRDVAFTNVMVDQFREAHFVDVMLDVFSHVFFDLSKVQLTSYLLASQCIDSNGLIGRPLADQQDGVTKIAVTNVQFHHSQQRIVVRLPLDVIALNCQFQYRIALIKTRCGNMVSYVSNLGNTFDSDVGTDFRLNCETAPHEGCRVSESAAEVPQLVDPIVPKSDLQGVADSITCNVENFKADFLGNGIDGLYNVTVSWDANKDSKFKTYLMRHGSAQRQLIQDSSSASDPDFDPAPVIAVSADSVDGRRISVKLNDALPSGDLHVFQICMIDSSAPMDSVLDWSQAPKRLVDLAAIPTLKKSDSLKNAGSLDDHLTPFNTKLSADLSNGADASGFPEFSDDIGALDNKGVIKVGSLATPISSTKQQPERMLDRESNILAVDPPSHFDDAFNEGVWTWFMKQIPTSQATSPPSRRSYSRDEYISLFGWDVDEREMLNFVFVFIFVITVISVSVFYWFILRKCCAKKRSLGENNKNSPIIFVQQPEFVKKPIEFVTVADTPAEQAKY